MKTCKTCGRPLEIRQTRRTPEQLKKEYYFSAYYFCPHCRKMYHDEKFKVINKPVEEVVFKERMTEQNTVQIWTDGACSHNGTPQAKAAWAFVSGEYEEKGMVIGKQTNNTAEAYAIYHALLWAGKTGKKQIILHSDSQISLHNLRKHVDQIKENREIFQKIYDVISENGLTVKFVKVLGHADNVNNNRADKLANGLVGIK